MTDDETTEVFRVLAQSGQIDRYEVPTFSINGTTLLAGLIIGIICGFMFGFFLAIRLFSCH